MTDSLVGDYLRELEGELGDLPRSRRRELLAEINEHIDSAMERGAGRDEAAIRNVLERLGDPSEIAQEARDRLGIPEGKLGAREVWALILVPIGGVVVPVFGWIVGVILLWSSRLWSTREKVAGTLLFPGGLLIPFYMLFMPVQTCMSSSVDGQVISNGCGEPWGMALPLRVTLFAISVVVPIVVALILARRARLRSTAL